MKLLFQHSVSVCQKKYFTSSADFNKKKHFSLKRAWKKNSDQALSIPASFDGI